MTREQIEAWRYRWAVIFHADWSKELDELCDLALLGLDAERNIALAKIAGAVWVLEAHASLGVQLTQKIQGSDAVLQAQPLPTPPKEKP